MVCHSLLPLSHRVAGHSSVGGQRQSMLRLLAVALWGGWLLLPQTEAGAAEVSARLSSKEAYVGAPLTLQIDIEDAARYELPELPEVAGVEILRKGAPQQSHQVSVFNGRMVQRTSVTFSYEVTPTREGSYRIPSMSIRADGEIHETEPLEFVATVSETGDLLFVELDGEESSVYVGQPIQLTLRIWIRPYRLEEQNQNLSEGDMWSMRSRQSQWGDFADVLEEMAQRRQRPAGRSVLREDASGQQREYYLYEIEAEIYPKKPGEVDAGGVNVVLDYPTKIGPVARRDPFGMDSPFSGVFGDDFFGVPFGREQMAVLNSRPIEADAQTSSIEVRPIPTDGRPDGYNGAVGQYRIRTQASPDSVEVGDQIKLKIGVTGSGPMELVRCPKLSAQSDLTADFKVSDQPLPGFVQDNMKVFAPTIRPKHEGVTEIPPIEFHFFNPETESFEVVKSEPIPIRVRPSEKLSLDSIVANGRRGGGQSEEASGAGQGGSDANGFRADGIWDIFKTSDAIESVPVRNALPLGWLLAVCPGLVWLGLVVWQSRGRWTTWLAQWKSPARKAVLAMEQADDAFTMGEIMDEYLRRQFGSDRKSSSWLSGVGGVRVAGAYGLAAEVESFLNRCQCQETVIPPESTAAIEELRFRGMALIGQLEKLRLQKRPSRKFRAKPVTALQSQSVAGTLAWVLAGWSLVSAGSVVASESDESLALDPPSMSVLFQEANQAYERGMQTFEQNEPGSPSTNDPVGHADSGQAVAKSEFSLAATRYQTLVDAGVENPQLYANLGNACLLSGQIGRAIVAYERALKWNPENDSIRTRLWLARDQVNRSSDSHTSWKLQLQRTIVPVLFRHWGSTQLRWSIVGFALAFWTLMILLRLRTLTPESRRMTRSAASFFAVMAALGGVVWWLATSAVSDKSIGYIVADQVTVRTGDGEAFPALVDWSETDGWSVQVVQSRGDWVLIRTPSATGWVPADTIAFEAMGEFKAMGLGSRAVGASGA
ncbi:BatD family protein [Rhodopirellula halodulae]|nr:BatD family protein [Rhodopirellula sp. JC740]